MRIVKVEASSSKYDIFIDSFVYEQLLTFLKTKKYSQKALIVTDTNVGNLYVKDILNLFKELGFEPNVYTVEAGERSKTFKSAEKIFSSCIENGLDRKSLIIALGGGVVGDLTGFIAATYMRGVPFIQIPTSLLAQVDSSVGGKVAVNHDLGKNLIGAFYQPDAVFINVNFLKTLPKREIYTGLGEIIKYGIIYDVEFFSYLEENCEKILSRNTDVIEYIIARSCEIKASVVGEDEKENGLRRILNFGHTIGHAIEKETRYIHYNHGEAVAIGMLMAARISNKLGILANEDLFRIKAIMERFNLPMKAEKCKVNNMIEDLYHDKKTINGIINWVLINKIGNTVIKSDVDIALVRDVMMEFTNLS